MRPPDGWLRRREPRRRPEPREDALPVVDYVALPCHFCGSRELRTYKTRASLGRRERFHVCRSCGRRFKSVELK